MYYFKGLTFIRAAERPSTVVRRWLLPLRSSSSTSPMRNDEATVTLPLPDSSIKSRTRTTIALSFSKFHNLFNGFVLIVLNAYQVNASPEVAYVNGVAVVWQGTFGHHLAVKSNNLVSALR